MSEQLGTSEIGNFAVEDVVAYSKLLATGMDADFIRGITGLSLSDL